jgi:hypothetical protein
MKKIKECELDFCTFNRDYVCILPTPPSIASDNKSECVLMWLTSVFFEKNKNFMWCNADYCSSNRNKHCTLSITPEIDRYGMCGEISFISVDEDIIESEKDEIQRKTNR